MVCVDGDDDDNDYDYEVIVMGCEDSYEDV